MNLHTLPLANFSSCRRWRYTLSRIFQLDLISRGENANQFVQFIGLNPSTADETTDDNTLILCQGYARRWGFGGMVMTNLFAWRDTDPRKMKLAADPIGQHNDSHLWDVAQHAGLIVCCWGAHGVHLKRAEAVHGLLTMNDPVRRKLHHLGLTSEGFPRHPLYMKKDLQPIPWS
jgi:hypothetical protein